MSTNIPLMTRTGVSHNVRILAFEAIPLHVFRQVTMVTCPLLCLANSPDLALVLISTTLSLKPSWSRSPLLLSQARRRRLTLPPLILNTCIPDALCVIHFPLYGHNCLDHRVQILQEKSHNFTTDGQFQAILKFSHLGHICGHIIICETC